MEMDEPNRCVRPPSSFILRRESQDCTILIKPAPTALGIPSLWLALLAVGSLDPEVKVFTVKVALSCLRSPVV